MSAEMGYMVDGISDLDNGMEKDDVFLFAAIDRIFIFNVFILNLVSSFSTSAGILKETNNPVQDQAKLESVRNDVDQDVFLMFNVVDENLSWYLEDNIQNCSDPGGVNQEDPDFQESNQMHGGRDVSQISVIQKRNEIE